MGTSVRISRVIWAIPWLTIALVFAFALISAASMGVARAQADADLSVTKADSADPVALGDNLTYTITVTNNGPALATGVTLTDTLPPGVTFVSATPSCGELLGTVTCNLGSIATSTPITIVVTPTATGTISNFVSVSGNETDPNTANNTATETTLVVVSADLSVTNNGPAISTGVMLTDTLPPGVAFVSATPDQGSCGESAGVVNCTLDTLPVASSITITIVVTTPTNPLTCTITNIASGSGNEADVTPANNTATESSTFVSCADLSVTKADSADPSALGDNLTYTVTVTNNGPALATGVTLTDTLPAFVTFVSATPSCGELFGTVTCNLGNVATSTQITIVVTPTATGIISNFVSVTGNETDPNPANNRATETTFIGVVADLSVAKSDSPDPATIGSNLTYTVTVTNNGPAISTGVMLTDTLPPGVAFVSATPSQGSCGESGGTVTCNLLSLASGNVATSTIEVIPSIMVVSSSTPASITNTASVSGNETDLNPANDTATETTTFTDDFNDFGFGGTTSGTITAIGDQILTIQDESSPDGVRITADALGGPAAAVVSVCGGASTLTFTAGDVLVVTCSSVTIEVISGTVEIVFESTGGNTVTTSLTGGNSLTVDPTSATITAPATNPDPVVVIVDGTEITLDPGESVTVTETESGDVEIDIKPGSDTNPINLKSEGVIPVAILGAADFDVTTVDVDSLLFGPDGASPAHNGHLEDVNGDGFIDLLAHFRTQATGIAAGDTQACLTGTADEVDIEGCDVVRTVGK